MIAIAVVNKKRRESSDNLSSGPMVFRAKKAPDSKKVPREILSDIAAKYFK